MLVHALDLALHHFLSIPYQKFSEKIISAKGVLCCMNPDPKIKKDIEEIERIMLITDDSLHISLFDIDRWIDPEVTAGDERVTFKVQDTHPNARLKQYGRSFSKRAGDDYYLQRKLCQAIDRVNAIIMSNIKDYSFDFKVSGDMFS